MRIALVADVHSNAPALRAALAEIRAHRPDVLLSLGDQVNLGPCPRETLALLREAGAVMLSGNHERYIRAVMDGDAAYAGANFESLRFNAARLSREDVELPDSLSMEGVTFCHALPGDDYFPIHDPARALPRLAERFTEDMVHIVSGHSHNPQHYRLPHVVLDGIGSTGCMDDGLPGAALYALLDIERGASVLRPMAARYDPSCLPGRFAASGMAEACPVMARIACRQMMENRDYLSPFVRRASALSRARGEAKISLAAWQEADSRFPWGDGLTTAAFWRGISA